MVLLVSFLLCSSTALHAEIIDRIAVTVGNEVITDSMIRQQLRLSALYDSQEPDFSIESRRKAAETLVSRILLTAEMEESRYPDPEMREVMEAAREVLFVRYPNEDAYLKDLARRGLTEEEVRLFMQSMIRSVNFVELRFRAGVQVSSEDIARYYASEFTDYWKRTEGGKPRPPLDEVADEIEEWITQDRITEASEAWLKQTRATAEVRFRDEVFP
jgi:hypothetical protein